MERSRGPDSAGAARRGAEWDQEAQLIASEALEVPQEAIDWNQFFLTPSAKVSQQVAAKLRSIAATPVEMRSAFERLLRMGELTLSDHVAAGARLEKLRRGWRELQPTEALRTESESLLRSYPLKAADALQLAAAWSWYSGDTRNCVFISSDTQLLEAAPQLGFDIHSA